MRKVALTLLLMMFSVFMVFSSLPIKNHASALSGTGVGIRKDGPESAQVGDIVEYIITVYNLGDYWIRNVTVMDKFPNGTSSFWNVSDLAPLGQLGSFFVVEAIHYNIHSSDVLPGNPPVIINHAEVSGLSDTKSLSVLVHADTNYPTIIITQPVGGYSVANKTPVSSTPITIYITLLSIITVAFSVFKHKRACKPSS